MGKDCARPARRAPHLQYDDWFARGSQQPERVGECNGPPDRLEKETDGVRVVLCCEEPTLDGDVGDQLSTRRYHAAKTDAWTHGEQGFADRSRLNDGGDMATNEGGGHCADPEGCSARHGDPHAVRSDDSG